MERGEDNGIEGTGIQNNTVTQETPEIEEVLERGGDNEVVRPANQVNAEKASENPQATIPVNDQLANADAKKVNKRTKDSQTKPANTTGMTTRRRDQSKGDNALPSEK